MFDIRHDEQYRRHYHWYGYLLTGRGACRFAGNAVATPDISGVHSSSDNRAADFEHRHLPTSPRPSGMTAHAVIDVATGEVLTVRYEAGPTLATSTSMLLDVSTGKDVSASAATPSSPLEDSLPGNVIAALLLLTPVALAS